MVAFHTALGDPQTLTAPEKTQALGNIGAMGVGFAGATGTIPDAQLPQRINATGRNLSTLSNNWDNATETGTYFGENSLNTPYAGWVIADVLALNTDYVWQIARFMFGAGKWQRLKVDGAWGAWEALRTTEAEFDARYLVKANAVVQSYTVATLPTPGTAGRIAWASDCRVFNGTGIQEGAAAGTGGLVTDNGTAWKIAGTNVTAVA